jgi:hypothetical protein
MQWILIVLVYSGNAVTSFTIPMKSEDACYYAMANAEDLGTPATSAHCIDTWTGQIKNLGMDK